jgi:hypothetical protein
MGIEYRIRFKADPIELERRLRALRFFVRFDAEHRLYLLDAGGPKDGDVVNGWVSLEEDGLYFCDNLAGTPSDRAMVFRAVIDLILEQSQTAEIEEL